MSDELEQWQIDLATKAADAIKRGERFTIQRARRPGKAALLRDLDRQMAASGWTVLAPGVYRSPANLS